MNDNVFGIGQHVVYGTHGVCYIEDIRDASLSSVLPPQTYYILKQIKRNSVIYVPYTNNTGRNKLRRLVTEKEISDLLSSVRGSRMEWNSDRKVRTARFHEILGGGLTGDLLLMIRCIRKQRELYYDTKKKLSGSDNDILQSAESMVKQEFSFVLGINEDDVDDYIFERIDRDDGPVKFKVPLDA